MESVDSVVKLRSRMISASFGGARMRLSFKKWKRQQKKYPNGFYRRSNYTVQSSNDSSTKKKIQTIPHHKPPIALILYGFKIFMSNTEFTPRYRMAVSNQTCIVYWWTQKRNPLNRMRATQTGRSKRDNREEQKHMHYFQIGKSRHLLFFIIYRMAR